MLDHEFDEKTQTTYIVLEYAENGTLFDYIKEHSLKDKQMMRGIFHSVCDAVEYMHTNNIMHRDIKVNFHIFSLKTFFLTGRILSNCVISDLLPSVNPG